MSEIRKYFESRWGETGRLVEIDLSQIEIIVQAVLAGDEAMLQDVRDGVDFHCKRLAKKLGQSYTIVYDEVHKYKNTKYIALRKKNKNISFMRAYGAYPKSISKATGLSVKEVDAYFKAEDELYPDIAKFNQKNFEAVAASRKVDGTTARGFPRGTGLLGSVTGRYYAFEEYDHPFRGGDTAFKDTKIKNYPIQGFAGEILRVFLGLIFRRMLKSNLNAVMINTVHDSILFDVPLHEVEDLVQLVEAASKQLVPQIERLFELKITVPLKYDVAVGLNWYDMEEYSG